MNKTGGRRNEQWTSLTIAKKRETRGIVIDANAESHHYRFRAPILYVPLHGMSCHTMPCHDEAT